MIGCQITRNTDGTIKRVDAFNGQPSKLYASIKEMHPNISEYDALRQYAKFYTPTFLNNFGNFMEGDAMIATDENGEPVYDQPALRFLQSAFEDSTTDIITEDSSDLDPATVFLQDNPEIDSVLEEAFMEMTPESDTRVLYGVDTQSTQGPVFTSDTLAAVGAFLDALGVDVRITRLDRDDALAAANFIEGTVDIAKEMDKRVEAWDLLPEEAAHWWYRLLKDDEPLKKALFDLAANSMRRIELLDQNYADYKNPYAFTEEVIGQLIAESIERIQKNKALEADTTFWGLFKKLIKKVISAFRKHQQTPFDIAAARIMAADIEGLMTVEDYHVMMAQADPSLLADNTSETISKETKSETQVVEDTQYFEYLQKRFRKPSRYLKKTIAKLQSRLDSSFKVLQTFKEGDPTRTDVRLTFGSKIKLFQKYPGKIALNSPIKLDGVKKGELEILNHVREAIKKENPSLKSVETTSFAEEVDTYINSVYSMSSMHVGGMHDSYNISSTFIDDRARHKKIGLYVNNEFFTRGHWAHNPFVFYSLTPYNNKPVKALGQSGYRDPFDFKDQYDTGDYEGDPKDWTSVMLHEIQTDILDQLKLFSGGETGKRADIARYVLKNDFYFSFWDKALAEDQPWSSSMYDQFKHALDLRDSQLREKPDTYAAKVKKQASEMSEDLDVYYTVARIFENTAKHHRDLWEEMVSQYFDGIDIPDTTDRYEARDIKMQHRNAIIREYTSKFEEIFTTEYNFSMKGKEHEGPFSNYFDSNSEKLQYYLEEFFRNTYNTNHAKSKIGSRPVGYKNMLAGKRKSIQEKYTSIPVYKAQFNRLNKMEKLTEAQVEKLYNQMLEQVDALQLLIEESDDLSENDRMKFYERFAKMYLVPTLHHALQTARANGAKEIRFAGAALTRQLQGNNIAAVLYAGPEETKVTPEERLKAQREFLIPFVAKRLNRMRKEMRDAGVDKNIIDSYKFDPENPFAVYDDLRATTSSEQEFLDAVVDKLNVNKSTMEQFIQNNIPGKFKNIGPIYNALSKIKGVKLRYEPTPGVKGNTPSYVVDLTDYNLEEPVLYGLRKPDPAKRQRVALTDNEQKVKQEAIKRKKRSVIASFLSNVTDPTVAALKTFLKEKNGTMYQKFMGSTVEDYNNNLYVSENSTEFADTVEGQHKYVATNEIVALMDNLRDQFGIEYAIVTPEEAREITSKSRNPWSGQKAFFIGDTVYFVHGFTPEIVMHEFLHPFVRSIRQSNPALFDKLLTEAASLPGFDKHLADSIAEYGDTFSFRDPVIQEEVLVKTFTEATTDPTALKSPKFKSFIEKIMFYIKQMLRKTFGKGLDLKKLSADTTLQELSNMLVTSDKFNVNTTLVSVETITMYHQELDKVKENLEKHYEQRTADLGFFVDEHFNAIMETFRILKSAGKDRKAIAEFLENESNRGFVNMLYKQIAPFTTKEEIRRRADNDEEIYKEILDYIETEDFDEREREAQYFKQKVSSMAKNLFTVESMVKTIANHMKDLMKLPDPKSALSQMSSYNKVIKTWENWVDVAQEKLIEEGVDMNDDILEVLGNIRNEIKNADSILLRVYADSVSDVVMEMVEPMNKRLEEHRNSEIQRLNGLLEKAKTDAQRNYYRNRINEEEARYKLRKIDRDNIKLYLAGTMYADTSLMNAYMINYIASADPIVGSFGKFLKNHMTAAELWTHAQYNRFANELDEILKPTGIKTTQIRKFADQMLVLDDIGYIDENKEVQEYLAYEFHSEFLPKYKKKLLELSSKVYRAKEQYEATGTAEDEALYAEVLTERDRHLQIFFVNKYTDEVYELDDQLRTQVREVDGKEVKVGEIAYARMRKIIETIDGLTLPDSDKFEAYQDTKSIDRLWKEYSKLHSTYDDYGNKKTGVDLAVAEVLQEHRKRKNEIFEWKQVVGSFETAYEAAMAEAEVKLEKDGVKKNDPEYQDLFNALMEEWEADNLRIKLNQNFYEYRQELLDRVREIFEYLEEKRAGAEDDYGYADRKAKLFADAYSEINDSMSGRRDEDGQPVGTDMSSSHIAFVKKLQEDMIEAKKELENLKGLTPKENEEYNEFVAKMKKKKRLTPSEQVKYEKYKNKIKTLGLEAGLKKELISLLNELDALRYNRPTDYYVEILQNWHRDHLLPNMSEADLKAAPVEINAENAEKLFTDPKYVSKFIDKKGSAYNKEFAKWFKANHILTDKWDNKAKARVPIYQRVAVWNVTRPRQDKFYETTKVTLLDGTEKVLKGIPVLKYFYRAVKPEYQTGYDPETGAVDPGAMRDHQGKNLPKSLEQMEALKEKRPELFEGEGAIPHDVYINRRYLQLKEENSPVFKALEFIKERFLEWQSNIDEPHMKNGYELPRYNMKGDERLLYSQNTEAAQRKFGPLSYVRSWFNDLKAEWFERKDDFERGLNYEDDWAYTSLVSMGYTAKDGIPVTGRYRVESDQVSRDIAGVLALYLKGVGNYKELKASQPIAEAFKKSINELDAKHVITAQRRLKPKLPVMTDSGEDKERRKNAINAMYETFWEGKRITGPGKDNRSAQKIMGNLMGAASFSFFAFDITSAYKNYYGAQFQIATEAAISRYKQFINYKDFSLARPWAMKAMGQISAEVYKTTSKSKDVQLGEIFDFAQGRFQDDFGESISRTMARDAASLSWSMSHRKWLELLATMQLFSGVMHSVRVEQNGKMIRYVDAWELGEDGNIKLKDGIDKAYDKGGKKFIEIRNAIHELSNLNQGAYSQQDSTYLDRYLAWRWTISVRKFFMKMAVNRVGYDARMSKQKGFKWINPMTWHLMEDAWNPALNDFHIGYYSSLIRGIGRFLQSASQGNMAMGMTPQESYALKRIGLDAVKVMLWHWLTFALFGYDPEDDERLAKLKEKSGAFPHFLVDEEWSEDFQLGGWLSQHAQLLMYKVDEENRFFWSPSSVTDLFGETSIVNGATLDLYLDLYNNLYYAATDDPRGYYKKDVGAMTWQQEDSWKGWKLLARMVGKKGQFEAPAVSWKNYEQIRRQKGNE